MVKTAYIFPGQGSQYVGMGLDLYNKYPSAKAVFDRADEVLGFYLTKLCFEGPEEELELTVNAQPALLVTSIATLEAAIEVAAGALPKPAYMAGHSLGEYTALTAAGALDFDTAVTLARERGRLMYEAGLQKPGAMAAIIGMSREILAEICNETGTFIANLNSPGQIVISGAKEHVKKAIKTAMERGAKLAVQLQVSGAFHSPLMSSAAKGLKKRVQKLPVLMAMEKVRQTVWDGASFSLRSNATLGATIQTDTRTGKDTITETAISAPVIPVIGNTTVQELTTAESVRDELLEQVGHCVLWEDSIKYLISRGVDNFIEIGPGEVLSGLVERIDDSVTTLSIGDCDAVEALRAK